MTAKDWVTIAAVAIVAFGVREMFPKREQLPAPPPEIVTVYDTTHDTVRLALPSKPMNQPNLNIRVTLHTPAQIPVALPPEQRPNLWPILSMQIGKSRGDTSLTTTFSLRSGQTAVSQVWTPGPLRSAWADSTMTPRLDFGPPYQPPATGLWTKVKWVTVGIAACKVSEALR